mgnify:CR=1 FL=1
MRTDSVSKITSIVVHACPIEALNSPQSVCGPSCSLEYSLGKEVILVVVAEEKKSEFDVETKVRLIVADMLLNMNDRMDVTRREIKVCQHELSTLHMKMTENNMKMDREAKIRDQVDQLKIRINNMVSSVTLPG